MSKGLGSLSIIKIAMVSSGNCLLNSLWDYVEDIQKELKAFDVIDSLFDFSTALRFPDNQPILMITNKRTNEYWEIPLTQEQYESMKEELL